MTEQPTENLHIIMKDVNAPGVDRRRYNTPTASEVAAFVDDNGGDENAPTRRDIVIRMHEQLPPLPNATANDPPRDRLQFINDVNQNYNPLRFPLLYPHGEVGWAPGISYADAPDDNDEEGGLEEEHDNNNTRSRYVTRREYFAYRLQLRTLNIDVNDGTIYMDSNILLRCGRLSQEFIVDAWCQVGYYTFALMPCASTPLFKCTSSSLQILDDRLRWIP